MAPAETQIELCARIAQEYADRAWAVYKGRMPEADGLERANPHTEGHADAGHQIARCILELSSAQPGRR